MPANVSVEFEKAKKKFEEARTPLEKLAALQEMRSFAPSHKGGEKLRAEISKKIALTKKEVEKQRKVKAKKGSGISFNVKKEGAGQIVLLGVPNSGKSFFLNKLTNVQVEIAPYAFTTKKPQVGIMDFSGARVQLVEMPALVEGSSEGKANGNLILSAVRNADAVIFVLEERNALEQLNLLLNELDKAFIKVNRRKPLIEVKHSEFFGLSISGENFLKVPKEQLKLFLRDAGYANASISLGEGADLKKVAEVLDSRNVYKKVLAVISKAPGKKSLELLDLEGKKIDFVFFNEKELGKLKEKIFLLLDKIIVFTKKPGQPADFKDPLVLEKNAIVEDVAKKLHKELAQNLRYVKLWGSSKFSGQRVSKAYILKDRDIIEIYS